MTKELAEALNRVNAKCKEIADRAIKTQVRASDQTLTLGKLDEAIGALDQMVSDLGAIREDWKKKR